MHSNALNTHVIVSHIAGTTWGDTGSIQVTTFTDAQGANNLFEHRAKLLQGANDDDADGDQGDTKFTWIMWYAKGRLIKYRKLDQ